jgi:hypothetical protein
MGAEELRKRRRSHDKYVDRKRVELSTPNLFTQTPINQPRCILTSIQSGASLVEGECLVIEVVDGALLATRSSSIVARCEAPPADILAAIVDSACPAAGVVTQVNRLSKTAELSIS